MSKINTKIGSGSFGTVLMIEVDDPNKAYRRFHAAKRRRSYDDRDASTSDEASAIVCSTPRSAEGTCERMTRHLATTLGMRRGDRAMQQEPHRASGLPAPVRYAVKFGTECKLQDADGVGICALRELCAYQHVMRHRGARAANIAGVHAFVMAKDEVGTTHASTVHAGSSNCPEHAATVQGSTTALVMDAYEREGHGEFLTFGMTEVRELMWGLLNALATLHGVRILHRDVKLGNVLWKRRPIARQDVALADFGSSRLIPTREPTSPPRAWDEIPATTSVDFSMTRFVYTLPFRAPELMLVPDVFHAPSMDMWAAGMTFFYLCTGVLCGTVDGMHSEYGTLVDIFKLLGTPRGDEFPALSTSRTWGGGSAFPKFERSLLSATRGSKLAGDSAAMDLLCSLLAYDPGKRPTAEEALSHPFFASSPLPAPPCAPDALGRSPKPAPVVGRGSFTRAIRLSAARVRDCQVVLHAMWLFVNNHYNVCNTCTFFSAAAMTCGYLCSAPRVQVSPDTIPILTASCLVLASKLYDVDCIEVGPAVSFVRMCEEIKHTSVLSDRETRTRIVDMEACVIEAFCGDLYSVHETRWGFGDKQIEGTRVPHTWFAKAATCSCATRCLTLSDTQLEQATECFGGAALCVLAWRNVGRQCLKLVRVREDVDGEKFQLAVVNRENNIVAQVPGTLARSAFETTRNVCAHIARVRRKLSRCAFTNTCARVTRLFRAQEDMCEFLRVIHGFEDLDVFS